MQRACLLLSKAEVPFAQVEEDGLAGLDQPLVQLVLAEAGSQPGQVSCYGLLQACQHQRAQQLVLHVHTTIQLQFPEVQLVVGGV